MTKCQSCIRCELPKFETEAPIHEKRKKHKSQVQQCPPCHCHSETTKYLIERGSRVKHTDNLEAMLEQYQNYLVDPQNSPIKRSKSPFSLPTGMRCRLSGDIHGSKRTPSAGQHQSKKNEYCEELHEILTEIINLGLVDENMEICGKDTYRKEHFQQNEQILDYLEESDFDSDSSKKSSPEHYQKKDKVGYFERSRESIEKCEKEGYEELKQSKRDCEEINQLTSEVKESEKMKGIRQNGPERMEKKKIKCRKEGDNQKRLSKSMKKSQIGRPVDLHSGNKSLGVNQRCKIEASTSYHSLPNDDKEFDNEAQIEFSNRIQLQEDLEENPYSEFSEVQKFEKNDSEILNLPDENELKNKREESNEGRKHLYAGGDLDLHACKSYVVDLIDRALSNQLGTHPGGKKGDVTKEASSWQEMCIEVTRALQGDYCQTFAQNLYNFQENMDNVKLLKGFRWAYVKHIQEELRSLEKIIDICSPRITKKESPTS
ncbi:uncharacterized protein LOC117167391 isoform X2 [Belonocnema kinseyi]|nr:uncharacterized protein LOC117167391 isoform X2 [Belonocnema kinseyi]